MNKKFEILTEYLKSLGSVAVAFSGGVDSTFLLKAAHDTLGDGAIAVTVRSRLFPERELAEAGEFCKKEGIRHITVSSEELKIEGFAENPSNRCYICKKDLFTKMLKTVGELGFQNVAEGSNTDDTGDYRPGLKAVSELGIKSPLRYAGLSKKEIRELSKELGLNTWDKQSFACLATRFVYGETITAEKLGMVDKAEQFLFDSGFSQLRVRMHGRLARIELNPDEFDKLLGIRERVYSYFKSLGFTYISLDLAGYRAGSMNEALK